EAVARRPQHRRLRHLALGVDDQLQRHRAFDARARRLLRVGRLDAIDQPRRLEFLRARNASEQQERNQQAAHAPRILPCRRPPRPPPGAGPAPPPPQTTTPPPANSSIQPPTDGTAACGVMAHPMPESDCCGGVPVDTPPPPPPPPPPPAPPPPMSIGADPGIA